ncbi:MAG: helix-turn-helix transcriptional regulator [Synergistes sp.]|nr:helix-turn-helix transcriptional regulator [Synergistes sp.]
MNLGLGNRIKQLRKLRGLTQDRLAEIMDISRVTISVWETDVNVPSAESIVELANILNVSTDFLLTGTQRDRDISQMSDKAAIFCELFDALPEASQIEVVKFLEYQEYLLKSSN